MKNKYYKLIELGDSKGFDPVDEKEISYVEALVSDCIPTEKMNYAAIFQLAKIGLQTIKDLEGNEKFESKEHNYTEFNLTVKLEYTGTPKRGYKVSFSNRGRFHCFSNEREAEIFYKGVCEGWEEHHVHVSHLKKHESAGEGLE